jgi:hypothetical protein
MFSGIGKKEFKFPSAHWAQIGPVAWPARRGGLPWPSDTVRSEAGQNGVTALLVVAQQPSGWPSSACGWCAPRARLA